MLGWLVPFALVLALASLFGRAFVPAAIGTVRFSDQLLLLDGFVAQSLGAISTVLLAVHLVRVMLSARAVPLRIVVTLLGGFSLLLAMVSSGGIRTPDPVLFAGSLVASAISLVVAVSGDRRLPELALGLASVAGVLRLVAVELTLRGSAISEVVATLGFVVELGIVGVAIAFLVRARVRGIAVLAVAIVLAAMATWLLVAEPDAPRWVMARHALENLAPRPRPLGPWLLAPVLATFSMVLAIGLCLARRAEQGVVGAVAVVVLVRAHAEIPLLGVALTIAAAALFLARAPAHASIKSMGKSAAPRGNSPQPPPAHEAAPPPPEAA